MSYFDDFNFRLFQTQGFRWFLRGFYQYITARVLKIDLDLCAIRISHCAWFWAFFHTVQWWCAELRGRERWMAGKWRLWGFRAKMTIFDGIRRISWKKLIISKKTPKKHQKTSKIVSHLRSPPFGRSAIQRTTTVIALYFFKNVLEVLIF